MLSGSETSFNRRSELALVLSDAVPQTGESWRQQDPDSFLNTIWGNSVFVSPGIFNHSSHPHAAAIEAHLATLVTGLALRRQRRALYQGRSHPDLFVKADLARDVTPTVVINSANRNEENCRDGQNGPPFFVAGTLNGVEIYTTDLSALSVLQASQYIESLHQIPDQLFDEFLQLGSDLNTYHKDGKQQFRSAEVAQLRTLPNFSEQIVEISTGEIPALDLQEGEIRLLYVDQFGNCKAITPNIEAIREEIEANEGRQLNVKIADGHGDVAVWAAKDLDTSPLGEPAIYWNSGRQDRALPKPLTGPWPGYLDFAVRAPGDLQEFIQFSDPRRPSRRIGYHALVGSIQDPDITGIEAEKIIWTNKLKLRTA